MPLFKFCNPDHNINRGAHVQIGTLFKYREIEDQDLRDEHEGKYRFHVTFPKRIELDRKWANLLLQGAVAFGGTNDTPRFPGSYHTYIENLHLVRQTDNSVVVEDTRIRIEREVPNCLMYCMSDFPSADKNPLSQYADHWSIPEHLATEFSSRLGRLIFEQAKLSSFDASISTAHSAATARELSLHVTHRAVIYQDRELVITPESRPSYEELTTVLANVGFVKPPKHSVEREYRFVFELHDSQRVYAPTVDRLLFNPHVLTSLTCPMSKPRA
jgi:hypothetical protein